MFEWQGQLARFLFDRLTPNVRAEVDRRRLAPRGTDRRRVIGMHVRRGDSCSLLSRFCPADGAAAYWRAAARLRFLLVCDRDFDTQVRMGDD